MQVDVTTTWELEREFVEANYARFEVFMLDVDGIFRHALSYADDPGECCVELSRVTFRGEPFTLTTKEERALRAQWTEELRKEFGV